MSNRVLLGLFGGSGAAGAGAGGSASVSPSVPNPSPTPDPAASQPATRKRSIRPMRIAAVIILLAAAVPAWRARHRIQRLPIPSGGSLLPALGSILPDPPVAPPETKETAKSQGPAKVDAHPAGAPAN